MEKEQELLWDMLPDGLSEYFDIELHEKTEKYFRITLIEKNIVPNLSKEYQGKPIINTVIKPITIDYFPIKGRKGELVLKRRSWKFEGVDKWLKREIDICVSGTKLEKEFADFLKEFDGDTTGMYQ
ncbi:MAG: hypothetical protein COW67_01705 [Flavobacteriales bacterium CG18_big_fil_WC_8_21_14_2_50_32_9]|nr:hypothetical protein [Bacteroidota bacterium]PIQ16671.1 MAG: hypothetical protein COW67_01705 [Flavobacteriales bacterium CG18_big_fil_WC_8_21_14_2_50_32_9]